MNRATSINAGASASHSTRLLFGFEGCWSSRHPHAVLAAVITLVLTADRIADVLAAVIAGAP